MIDIDISDALRHPGREYGFSYEGSPDFEGIGLAEPLSLHATYGCYDDTIRVQGGLRTALALECARCLAAIAYPVDASFAEVFLPAQEADGDSYTFQRETKRVSLDQMVLDILGLEAPITVLCSEDCKGLCPVCGSNLNDGPCVCGHGTDGGKEDGPDSDNPFAKLKNLF